MATAVTDILGGMTFSEEGGMLMSLTRSIHVSAVSATTPAAAVVEILAACPSANSKLTVGDNVMVAKSRGGKVGKDKNDCTVTIEYENAYAKGDPDGNISTYAGGTALQQVTSQVDREGEALTVTYKGQTVPIEIQADEAQGELVAEVVEYTNVPGELQLDWENRVNSTTWQTGAPGTWRCTSVRWKLRSWTDNSWDFTYEFQRKPTGWQPEGVYIDPKTKQPPPDWKTENAFVEVDWYATKNFHTKFPG